MPQTRTLSQFKNRLAGGGARPNLFEVEITPGDLPSGVAKYDGDVFKYMCKAANLPASQIGVVEVPFRGRVLKIAGDRTFEPWTITIMNDTKFTLRNAFELWANSIQAANENYTAAGTLGDASDSTGYFADISVHQLARDLKDSDAPSVLKSYKFYNVFPSSVSSIDLDFGNNDAIEEFTVELQVQYWAPTVQGQ